LRFFRHFINKQFFGQINKIQKIFHSILN